MAYSDDNQYFEEEDGVYIEYINPIKETILPLIVVNEYPDDIRHTSKFNELGYVAIASSHNISIVEFINAFNYGSFINLGSRGSVKLDISTIINNFDKWKKITIYNTNKEVLDNIVLTLQDSGGNTLATVDNSTDLESYDIINKEIFLVIKNNAYTERNITLRIEFLQKGYNTFIDVNNIYNYGLYLNTVFNDLNETLINKSDNFIHKTIKINDKTLESDITLTCEDIGAYKRPMASVCSTYFTLVSTDKNTTEVIVSSGIPYNTKIPYNTFSKFFMSPLTAPENHNIVKVNNITSNNPNITVLNYSHYKNKIFYLIKGKLENSNLNVSLTASYEYNEVETVKKFKK